MSLAAEPQIGGQDWTGSSIQTGSGGSGPGGGRGGDVGAHNVTKLENNPTTSLFSNAIHVKNKVTTLIHGFETNYLRGNGNVGNTIIHKNGDVYTMNNRSSVDNSTHNVANNQRQFRSYLGGFGRVAKKSILTRHSSLASSTKPVSPLSTIKTACPPSRLKTEISSEHDILFKAEDLTPTRASLETSSPARETSAEFVEPTTQVEATSVPATSSEDCTKKTQAIRAQSSGQLDSVCTPVNKTPFPTLSSPLDVEPGSAQTAEPVVDKMHWISEWAARFRRETESQVADITTFTSPLHASVASSSASLIPGPTNENDRLKAGAEERQRADQVHHGLPGVDDMSDSSSLSGPSVSESTTSVTNSSPPTTIAQPLPSFPLETVAVAHCKNAQDCNECERESKRENLDQAIQALTCALTDDLPAQLFKGKDDMSSFAVDLRKLVYEMAQGVEEEDQPLGLTKLYSFSEQETFEISAQLQKLYPSTRKDVNHVFHLSNLFLSNVVERIGRRFPCSLKLELPNIYHEYGLSVTVIFSRLWSSGNRVRHHSGDVGDY